MAIEGIKECAVPGCILPISGQNNLCDEHRLPGGVVCTGDSTFVITTWTAEHGDEAGIILLNDWALGNHFGGGAGFEKRLREQGFTDIRNIRTPAELKSAKQPANGKKFGSWSGPWRTKYPWEVMSEEAKVQGENLKKVKGPGDPRELLPQICKAILSHMQPVGIKHKKDETLEDLPITDGFMWLRITPAQLSELLSPHPAEADLAAVVVVFPADVCSIVSVRFDVRVIHAHRSVDCLAVSIAQDNCIPRSYFKELTEPYNAMHALHLVFAPGDSSDQTFVLAEFSDDGLKLTGWVDSEDASQWAAEGGMIVMTRQNTGGNHE